MITVTVLSTGQKPLGEGLPFQLIANGAVVGSAKTDAAGVVTFDVDPSSVAGPFAIRLDTKALGKDGQQSP
jgi:hypothetical protein